MSFILFGDISFCSQIHSPIVQREFLQRFVMVIFHCSRFYWNIVNRMRSTFFSGGLIQHGMGGYPPFRMSVIAFDISIANIFSLHTALSVMQKSSESVLMLRLVASNWISWCVWHVIASYLFILSLSPRNVVSSG